MISDKQYADRHVSQFRGDDVAQIVARGAGRSRLLVSRIRREAPDHGIATPAKSEEVFSVLVQLRRQEQRELYLDDKLVHRGAYAERTVSVVNHLQRPTANLLSAFDTVIFTIPKLALNETTEDHGAPPIEHLSCANEGRFDETIWHLVQSLLPALERPEEVGSLYAERVLLASTTYFAHAFGGMRPPQAQEYRLSPAQKSRVVDLMLGQFGEEMSLSRLAGEIDVTPRQFVRAFLRTTGETPDDWMRRQRIERAKTMLRESALPVSRIAALCGFASPAQFSRVFALSVGIRPALWRRQVLN